MVDIQAAHMRRFGDMLFREQLDGLVKTLDDYLFLDNETSLAEEFKIISSLPTLPFLKAAVKVLF